MSLLFQQITERKKRNQKLNIYLDLAREQKKLWNMEVTVIPIIVGACEIIPQNLRKRLEELRPSTPEHY